MIVAGDKLESGKVGDPTLKLASLAIQNDEEESDLVVKTKMRLFENFVFLEEIEFKIQIIKKTDYG